MYITGSPIMTFFRVVHRRHAHEYVESEIWRWYEDLLEGDTSGPLAAMKSGDFARWFRARQLQEHVLDMQRLEMQAHKGRNVLSSVLPPELVAQVFHHIRWVSPPTYLFKTVTKRIQGILFAALERARQRISNRRGPVATFCKYPRVEKVVRWVTDRVRKRPANGAHRRSQGRLHQPR